jgi:hypothetical protein
MSTFTVDLDALQKGTATGPAPAGRYDAYTHKITPMVSKKGNEYHQIIFELIDGEYTDAETTDRAAYVGRKVYCNKPWMFPELLRALEVIRPGQGGQVSGELESLIDYPVVIDLSIKEFNGKLQNEVEAIFGVEQVPQPAPALPGFNEDIPF